MISLVAMLGVEEMLHCYPLSVIRACSSLCGVGNRTFTSSSPRNAFFFQE